MVPARNSVSRALLIVAVAFFAAGCPSAGDESAIVETCAKSGVQCRISGGKLGVCMMNTDGSFECASQH